MSHIHIPDGVLPPWLWISGYVVMALLVTLLWKCKRQEADTRRFALIGIFAALMILVMSIEILPYHANLSVVASIVLGPPLAIMAGLIVNFFLSFLGHGGITVVGLNTLVIAVEMIVGYGMFHQLRRVRLPLALSSFLAVVVGLALSSATSLGIVAAGVPAINQSLQAPAGPHAEEQARHEHEPEPIEQAAAGGRLNLARLAVIMFGIGAIGWMLEGIFSAAILVALNRIYPGLTIVKG